MITLAPYGWPQVQCAGADGTSCQTSRAQKHLCEHPLFMYDIWVNCVMDFILKQPLEPFDLACHGGWRCYGKTCQRHGTVRRAPNQGSSRPSFDKNSLGRPQLGRPIMILAENARQRIPKNQATTTDSWIPVCDRQPTIGPELEVPEKCRIAWKEPMIVGEAMILLFSGHFGYLRTLEHTTRDSHRPQITWKIGFTRVLCATGATQ